MMNGRKWGQTKEGEDILVYDLKDPNGPMQASVMNFGATLLTLEVTAKDGALRDVVLGHERPEDYFESGTYYGMTVARCANRIGGAQFTLNGRTYQLDKNDGNNTNHSGAHSLSRRIWQVTEVSDNAVTFSYDSPDGDMGFPGQMRIDVTYTVKDNALYVDYHALADQDTVFNPTHHSYFQLMGHGNGDILDHSLVIHAKEVTYANEESVPDGTIRPVADTPMDFRTRQRIGDRIDADYDLLRFASGYDHNYILCKDEEVTAEELAAHGRTVTHAATLYAPDESLVLSVYTDCPGFQIYAGNFIPDGSIGKGGKRYPRRGGIALETQFYPNALNIPSFPQPIIREGEDYYSRTVYRFD